MMKNGEETLNSNNAPWGFLVIYLHWGKLSYALTYADNPLKIHSHKPPHSQTPPSSNRHKYGASNKLMYGGNMPQAGLASAPAPAPLPIRTDESH